MSSRTFTIAALSLTVLICLTGPGAVFGQEGATHLGPEINSPENDFGPIVTADGNALYFTSERDGGLGGQDIWVSRRKDGKWSKPENLGKSINTVYHEGPDSFSPDEKVMYFSRNVVKENDPNPTKLDIYTAAWNEEKKQWGDVKRLGDNVNSKYSDGNASISHDGLTLYFVSDRPQEGKNEEGDWDIFVSKKKKEGDKWGPAKRLGAPINTSESELHVIIHQDGENLYFSSSGHKGLGGADIFVSKIVDGKYQAPVNLGDTINTVRDDVYFTIPAAGDLAYLASDRAGGLGMQDIYAVPVPMGELKTTGLVIIKGIVADLATCPKPDKGSGAKDIDPTACKPIKGAKVVATSGEKGERKNAITD